MPSDQKIFDDAFQVATSCAYIMPYPWGPLAAAELTLLQVLTSGMTGPSFGELIQRAVRDLESFALHQQLLSIVSDLKRFTAYLDDKQADFAKVAALKQSKEYLQGVLNELDRSTGPNGYLNSSVYALQRDELLALDGTIELLVLACSLYILALKFRIQINGYLAAYYQDVEPNPIEMNNYTINWLAAFSTFQTEVSGYQNKQGLADFCANWISTFKRNRLAQISLPQWDSRWSCVYFTDDAVYSFLGDFWPRNIVGALYTPPPTPLAIEVRYPYYMGIYDGLESRFERALDTIQGWRDAVQSWSQQIPPQQPGDSPECGATPWTALVPQGENWKAGNSVAYAVKFVNRCGPSPLGKWSDEVVIDKTAFPPVSVPVDPLGMATARHVFRRMSIGGQASYRVVKILPENTTGSFTDTEL